MRHLLSLVLLATMALGSWADKVKGEVVKVEGQTLVLKLPDQKTMSLRTEGPASVKKGDRVEVEFSTTKVAVARGGQRVCETCYDLKSVKKLIP